MSKAPEGPREVEGSLGGDLNCVMNQALDRSSTKPLPPSKMSQALSSFLNEIGCLDPWRFF